MVRRKQPGGNQRRRPGGDDPGDLVGQRGARVAHAGPEELREPRRLHRIHRGLTERHTADIREYDVHRVAGFDQLEEQEAIDGDEHRAHQVDRPPTDAVGELAEQRQREELDRAADENGVEEEAAREPQLLGAVGEHENVHHVEGDVGRKARAERQHDLFRMALQKLDERSLDHGATRLDPLEHRRLDYAEPDEETDADQHDTQEERNAPAPGEELVVGQLRYQGKDASRQKKADRNAELRKAAEESALAFGRALDDEQHRSAPLAPHAQTLDEAHRHEQYGRPDSDRVVGRQNADDERRDTHDHQRCDERHLASDAIAEMAEENGPERPRHVADRKGSEGRDRADQRVERRKEELAEDERRSGPVQKEVVPLDGGTHDRRDQDAVDHRPVR